MLTSNLIGFSGPKGIGKNFVANVFSEYFTDKFDLNVYSGAFADALKNYCADYLGIDRKLLYGSEEDKRTLTEYRWENIPYHLKFHKAGNGSGFISEVSDTAHQRPTTGFMTVREVLQIAGTEMHRNTWDQDIWVKTLIRKYREMKSTYHCFLVTDVRFPNEARAILDEGGRIFMIQGPQRGGVNPGDQHVSEQLFAAISTFSGVRYFKNDTREQIMEDIKKLDLIIQF
jgi:hypothetical protein